MTTMVRDVSPTRADDPRRASTTQLPAFRTARTAPHPLSDPVLDRKAETLDPDRAPVTDRDAQRPRYVVMRRREPLELRVLPTQRVAMPTGDLEPRQDLGADAPRLEHRPQIIRTPNPES